MSHPFIMVAPNGARRGHSDHPALPVTLAETVQTARACHAAGAGGLHLHIRDATGAHSLDGGQYREALAELAQAVPGMEVQITTEAAGVFDVQTQLACLHEVRPGWASIALREIAREPELAEVVYATCEDNGTRVQHILYDTDDLMRLFDWQARGIVRPAQSEMLFVLGRYTSGQASQPHDLDPFLAAVNGKARWMLCAFGDREHDCLLHAARLGGDLRVGFENSLRAVDGTLWPDCAASVTALAERLQTLNTGASAPQPELNES